MRVTPVVKVGANGAAVIPAEIRRELRIRAGSELVALSDGGAVVLVPRSAVKPLLRSVFAGIPVSLRDELIGERRAEARREGA